MCAHKVGDCSRKTGEALSENPYSFRNVKPVPIWFIVIILKAVLRDKRGKATVNKNDQHETPVKDHSHPGA